MKKLISATLLSLAVISSAHAKDPCETLLCMAGKLQGKGVVDGCDGPVADFFDIVKKKHGKFRPDETQDARREFVNECPTPGNWGDKVADKYGRIQG